MRWKAKKVSATQVQPKEKFVATGGNFSPHREGLRGWEMEDPDGSKKVPDRNTVSAAIMVRELSFIPETTGVMVYSIIPVIRSRARKAWRSG